ncbi:MAG: helix-turn-helix domain-containing protein [Defluviitaleaceae bacterium]|nr:helix-turn-helix domain-containing protein [Defluviitaleaceae bacterium]
MDILEKIKTLQREKGWSMTQLAKEAELTPSTLSTLYQRNNLPTIPTLQAICKALGITVSQFFADSHLPIDLTTEQAHLLENWNRLSNKQKIALLSFIKSI